MNRMAFAVPTKECEGCSRLRRIHHMQHATFLLFDATQ